MTNRHRNKCSTLPIFREKQVKTTRYHLTPIWMAIIKKTINNKYEWERGEKGTLVHWQWECNLVQPLWETVWNFIKKLKIELFTIRPSNSMGFPRGSNGKESACSAGDYPSIPGSGRSPGGGHGNPLQCSCLENPTDRGAWRATVHGVRYDWATNTSLPAIPLLGIFPDKTKTLLWMPEGKVGGRDSWEVRQIHTVLFTMDNQSAPSQANKFVPLAAAFL